MASRVAMSVKDVWERLETVKSYVNSRRQIDLSKRDIEFLLEYRVKHESYREELARRTVEMDCIKLILQTMNPGFTTESSLEDLAKLPLPSVTSDMVNKIYHIALINKILKLAVKDGLDNVKNGAKIPIPRDSNSTPSFYNIIKGVKKKTFNVEKDLERATKLWLWVKKQSERLAVKKSTSQERPETKAGIPKTQSLTALGSILPTPAPSKPPHHSNSGGVTNSLGYQCHLLLNRHPASSKISSPEYRKLTALEDKLKYILDDLDCLRRIAPQTMNAVQNSSQKETVALQTEMEDVGVKRSAKRQERSSQTSPKPPAEVPSSKESNKPLDQSTSEDVFLPNSTLANGDLGSSQMMESCFFCKKRYSKHSSSENLGGSFNEPLMEYDECQSSFNSTVITGKHLADRQLSLASQMPVKDPVQDHNGNIGTDETTDSFSAEEIKELLSIKTLYQNVLRAKNSTSAQIQGRRLVRRGSAPAAHARRTSVTYEHEQITPLLPLMYTEPNPKVDRGVSARSAVFTPAKRRTVMTRNDGTQTVQFVDPEQASQEELLGDDVPDENGIRSYSDYRPNQSADYESFSRSVASPDSETNIIWSVASKLKPGQWKELFKKLMQKSDEMIVPQEIKEDICTIMEEHQGDKMQAVESLEHWRQINGSFPINVLLDALTDIRRKDIVNAVRKQVSRLNQLH